MMKARLTLLFLASLVMFSERTLAQPYKIVSTDVSVCYNNSSVISCPLSAGDPFYGQFPGTNMPSYQSSPATMVTDMVTGLIWQRSPDQNGNNDGYITKADKLTWPQIQSRVASLNASAWGGYSDWRIPSIKELYSLTNWNGTDPSGYTGTSTAVFTPYIDTAFFQFAYGDQSAGERMIDSQYASSDLYNETGFSGSQQLFGFNFADGRIKGYDLMMPGGVEKVFSFQAVRGNASYGLNEFVDNADGTITDLSTGLMWTKDDSQAAMNWEEALAWVQAKNAVNHCGHGDWRMPNVKELQSIVDYSRSPGSTASAAIDPVFNCTQIVNEAGKTDYPWFWTGTTHRSFDGNTYHGDWAAYVCFGRAVGWMQKMGNNYFSLIDVHGAGAQRSSPKSGTFTGNYLGLDSLGQPVYGLGPQGDVLRTTNFVRLVRDYAGASGVNDGLKKHGGLLLYPDHGGSSEIVDMSRLAAGIADIAVFDCLGKLIFTERTHLPGKISVNLDDFRTGMYIVRVVSETGTLTGRFVKR